MPTSVTGSPLAPFADAVFTRLSTDATLVAMAPGGIFAAIPVANLVNPLADGPYVFVGHRTLGAHAGAMQREGGDATVVIDVWSAYNGPSEAQDIQSRIRVLLQRNALVVPRFVLYAGSVMCEQELCFQDYHPDMPKLTALFHGVQRWTGLLEEAA